MAQAVRAQAPGKLVMFAMENDNPNMFTATLSGTSTTVPQRFAQIFDIWGINIYAGMADTLDNYATYVANGSDTQRPLIVSEWGVPAGVNVPQGAPGPPNGNATARELTTDEFTSAINDNMWPDAKAMQAQRSFVAGAQFFEWSDEWWKNGSTPVYEQNASASPAWPEEWWGLYGIAPVGRTAQQGPWNNAANQPFPPDQLTARPTVTALSAIYAELASG
jgi:hypothetical protein